MIKRNRRTKTVALTAVMAAVVVAVYAFGLFIPDGACASDFLSAGQKPNWEHPFGTDALGRDVLMRTLKGMSVSMSIGIAASVISGVIAAVAGIAAATGSKKVDAFINWCIDLVMGVPHTIVVILISFAMGRGMKGLLVGIAATHWCSLARLIRSEVLQLKNQQYVAVSRRLGKSGSWILLHHLMPHLAPQFLVGLILMFPHAILHEASVSFLGYGLPPEQPAIGMILSESMMYISTGKWWMAVFPGLTMVLTVLLIDRLGDNLKKITDPSTAQE